MQFQTKHVCVLHHSQNKWQPKATVGKISEKDISHLNFHTVEIQLSVHGESHFPLGEELFDTVAPSLWWWALFSWKWIQNEPTRTCSVKLFVYCLSIKTWKPQPGRAPELRETSVLLCRHFIYRGFSLCSSVVVMFSTCHDSGLVFRHSC